jgi:hypothetical protein
VDADLQRLATEFVEKKGGGEAVSLIDLLGGRLVGTHVRNTFESRSSGSAFLFLKSPAYPTRHFLQRVFNEAQPRFHIVIRVEDHE